MNFTLDELIDRIKYHGHQYGLTTLEILEGIARQVEDEKLQLEQELENSLKEQVAKGIDGWKDKYLDSEIDRVREIQNEELLQQLDRLFENTLDDINQESETMVKLFPGSKRKTLLESDEKRQVLTEFFNKVKKEIQS